MAKQDYRVRNWSDYNQSLIQRGSLTFWFDEESIANWLAEPAFKRGRPQIYSDIAIECALMIGSVFHLPLRATQGFMSSLIELADLPLPTPHYTTLCRRRGRLEIELEAAHDMNEPLHIAVDSTGLKVYGEGEWKVRQHGVDKRRTWRKLHIGVDTATHQIVAAVVTTNDFKDSEVMDDILEQMPNNSRTVSADGAYDTHDIHQAIADKGAVGLIPPRKDAVLRQHGNCKAPAKPRDEVLRQVKKKGRKNWKLESGYHQRSLAETAMFRFKQLLGGKLCARIFENQAAEALLKCKIINKITSLGMPVGSMCG